MTLDRASASRESISGVWRDSGWWLFCLVVLSLKLFLLGLDPTPKIFMGDSSSYLWTALSGWIPADRSFFYGYLIRWVSVFTQSLGSLLLFQMFLGAATAILVGLICRTTIGLQARTSYFFGLLCAIDPLQLLWERYVMTETVSLFLYLLVLVFSFSYLRERRWWQLFLIQVFWLLVIGFRISYLLAAQASTLFLPLIAWYPEIKEAFRKGVPQFLKSAAVKAVLIHLALSFALLFLLHSGYQWTNGRLSKREPAYLYATGLNLLAMWAPALRPSDASDPRLAKLIADGDRFGIRNPGLRGAQRYRRGQLVDRWQRLAPGPEADKIARQTAMQALLHQPQEILLLGWETFRGYWDYPKLHRQAIYELGDRNLPAHVIRQLAVNFRLAAASKAVPKPTILQRYFLRSQPYWYLVLLAPLIAAALGFFSRRRYVTLLLLHLWILLVTTVFFTVTATVRYLQPLSLLALIVLAALVKYFAERRTQSPLEPLS